MPTIILSDATFAELKSLAEPFVDTPESLTARIIHAEVLRRNASPNGMGFVQPAREDSLRLNPDAHENLAHARLISATVDGQPIHRPKWNSLMDYLHVVGLNRLGSFDALRRASGARLRQARYEDEGYKYLPEADLSIQGVDSNLAWDHSLRLARVLRLPITVTFEWRDKAGATHPGQRGVLEWAPTSPATMGLCSDCNKEKAVTREGWCRRCLDKRLNEKFGQVSNRHFGHNRTAEMQQASDDDPPSPAWENAIRGLEDGR